MAPIANGLLSQTWPHKDTLHPSITVRPPLAPRFHILLTLRRTRAERMGRDERGVWRGEYFGGVELGRDEKGRRGDCGMLETERREERWC